MNRALFIAVLLIITGALTAGAATIVIVNMDGPGEGFNDTTPATPIGGNPGTTVGEQRLNVFYEAADIWGALLPSAVTIRVEARFNPQTCTETSAVLGSAGPIEVEKDFSGAELPDTWYNIALANKLAGVDLSGDNDISATFNSNINGDPSCLGGASWYYGYDGNEGTDIDLLPVLLHEIGHGLGFMTLVGSDGSEFFGSQDIYETFIHDNTTGLNWDEMNNAQRAASAINTDNVVWDGAYVTAHAPLHLGGAPTMFVNSPPALPPTITIGSASFGPALTDTGVTGDVVLVDDGTGTVTDACEPLINGAAVNGNIALIDRGSCTFVSKALAAQAEGAIAVIIANNQPTGAIALGGNDPSVVIPVVSVSQVDGNAIKAQLGTGVNVTLQLNPSQLAGTDTTGHVLLYAPNPYEGGSSISHFDPSALPNLLMEPAASSDLTADVDLTLAHFTDIGWLDHLPTGVADEHAPSRDLVLLINYPNPFNPSTTIRFELSSTQSIELAIFDVTGRLVRSLYTGVKGEGLHEELWNGMDEWGTTVASGVYYVRLAGASDTMTRKIVLLK
jgi:hypothetical protein